MGSVTASYFKVYGSNDQVNWTEISDVTSDDYDDGAFRVGWVEDKTPYRYVKATVLDVINIQGNKQTALWAAKPLELAVYGKPVGHVDEHYEFTDEVFVGYNRLNVDFEPYGQKPVIVDGRTLVPLRAIFEAMGAEVDWDGESQKVTATRDGITINLNIGSNELVVNGETVELDVPAQLINNTTMVPVRAIAESFNCEVDWNDGARRVYIKEAE
ncbi:MAG: copper amine oxidase N-terminal domain-containing protein [Oscillospiraceae bacterium]|nr:copper amine oxidase N-terminal domain-containing protein [Oscillospiraceae bacterium]